MSLVEWRDEFRTGIASVDHEHESLIALLNELHGRIQGGSDEEAVADFLGEVYARIAAHFALEERIMRERGYDEYQDHKADHEHLLDGIRDIMEDHAHGAYADFDAALSAHLQAWFTQHFKTRDARLHRILG